MKRILFLLAFSGALFVGCNKLSLKDTVQEAAVQSPVAVQKMILEYYFSVQTEGLGNEQIQQQYDEFMQLLPEEERTGLVEMMKQILAQAPSNDNVTAQGAGARATESLLSNGAAGDGFGQGVATVGNKVYVGATQVQKVFEYSKEGGSYTLTDEITPSSSSTGFGTRVSVSGSWMAVGAPGGGSCCPGKVLMFKKQGSSWVQKAILTGPANEIGFGRNLVLHGGKLAVSSVGQGFPDPGSTISVFEQSGNNWSLSGTIFKPGYSWFGIDMDEGGERIVGTGPVNNNSAIVRAVIFIDNGTNWVMEDEVIVPSPVPFAIALPIDIGISYNTIVLTAIIPGTKHWVIGNNGGDWEVEQELIIPAGQTFSRYAAIQESTIVIGAASSNNSIPDAVHVFNYDGSSWVLSETLTPSDNGVNALIRDVAISGNTIVAGCPQSPNTFAGKAYVWD